MVFSLLDLHILSLIAAGRTLTEIGDGLSISHGAISKAIHAAEARSRLSLVEHRGRRLVLTPTGRFVAGSAERLLSEHRAFEQLLADVQTGKAGPLRIVAAPVPGQYILPRIVEEFRQAFPAVDIALDVASSDELWTLLLARKHDLAVAPLPRDREKWSVHKLYEDRPTFFVAPSSQLAARNEVEWEEISDETVIGPFSQPYWSQLWRDMIHGKPAVSRAIPVRGIDGVKRLVQTGAGVGVLFRTALRKEFADGIFKPIRVSRLSVSYPFYVIQQRGAQPLPIVEHFRRFLIGRMTCWHAGIDISAP